MDSLPLPVIRRARPEDGPTILSLIDALAGYEKLDPPGPAARERLLRDMFSVPPRIEPWLCEVDGKAVGYALTFETYSSFLALPTFYLEDIFILPEMRKRKVGHLFFTRLREEAEQRGCGRMEWTVLDWNSPAIGFYQKHGAREMKEWQLYRIDLRKQPASETR